MNKKKKIPALRFPEFQNSEEWEEKKLEEIAKITMGSSPKSSSYNNENIGLPFLQGNTDIKDRKSAPRLYTSEITKTCKKNDILLSVRAPVGTVAKSLHNACIGRGLSALRAIGQNFQDYLYHILFAYEPFWQKVSQGGVFEAINTNEIQNLVLPIPLPQEQQKIAACLSSLDDLIEAHTEKLNLLEQHKKGLMQNLFPQEGQKVPNFRFPEFKNDGEWEEKKLGEIAKYKNGKAHEKDIDDKGKYIVVNSKFISTEGERLKFSNAAYCLAKKGDILMVLSDVPNGRAIAKCFYVDEDDKYTVNQRICKISTSKEHNSYFIFYILNRNPYFLSFDDGVKQTNLKKQEVENFTLLLPSIKEQHKIADCLSSLDNLITAERENIEQLKQHKKGLMQGLFVN